MGNKLQQEVAKTVWPWRDGENKTPSNQVGKIRMAAVGQGIIGGLIGTGVYLYLSPTVGYVAFGISALLTLVGLASPTGLYAKIRALMEGFGRVVGLTMAWVLLVPVYYLFFTPFRIVFRGGKKDAMTRWLERDADTYWTTREGDPKKEAYERQF